MMKLHLYILQTFIVGCLSAITTRYKHLQQDGYLSKLDMLQCQLRANGNTSCAIRFNTTTSNGVLEEQERCEQLNVDWCMTEAMESGYSYFGKSVVSQTPPFTFYHWTGTWEIWEIIPIMIKRGAQLTVEFTAPYGPWSKIRMNFINANEQTLYEAQFYPSSPVYFMGNVGGPDSIITPGAKSIVSAVFDTTAIRLFVNGMFHVQYTYPIEQAANIRILQFVFFDILGEINRVLYKAAP